MGIATDKTAVAVLSALNTAGYSNSDIISFLTPIVPPSGPVIPPVTPQTTAVFGLNTAGVDDPGCDPDLHPEILPLMQHFGFKYMRLWSTAMLTGPMNPKTQFGISSKYSKAGITPIYVINFQTSRVRNMAPNAADWSAVINSIPDASVIGQHVFEIGSEIDYTSYYNDTIQNFAILLAAAYPILKAKGHIVLCGNVLYSLDPYKQLKALNAFVNCDYIGGHFYFDNAPGALNAYATLEGFAASVGKPVMCTEVGLHMSKSGTAAWAAELGKLYTGLKTHKGIYCYFMLYTNVSDAGPESLLVAKTYVPNQPFYGVMDATLTGSN